ncbi:MAG: DUF3383 family protein [Nanoarchaeota archaeon]|nr:DUF3383 family protein [Nanoarchaeota archaeon]
MSLKEIVNVTITRETKAVSRVGFGTLMILGRHKRFNARLQYFSSLTGMAGVFNTTDAEYIAATVLFSQNPSVVRVAIGRRKTGDNCILSITDVQNNTDYEALINGTSFKITSGGAATAILIAAALVAAINGGAEPVTATDNLDGTFDLDPDVAGIPYSVKEDSKITLSGLTTPDPVATDLTAVQEEQSDWYGLALTWRTQADVEAAAAWTEANVAPKTFGAASSDANIIDTTDAADSTTIAAVLKANNYARTFCIYSGEAGTKYPECAVFGQFMPLDAGSYTVMFKTLAAIVADDLSETQSINARAKNCNVYEEIGGVDIVREGKVAEGEYIDVIVFVDWVQARMTERIYAKMVNLPKVPYTDEGVGVIETEIKGVLSLGIDRGGLAADPPYTVTAPDVADVPTQDKADRLLPDIKFRGTLAGAIHATDINGVVAL